MEGARLEGERDEQACGGKSPCSLRRDAGKGRHLPEWRGGLMEGKWPKTGVSSVADGSLLTFSKLLVSKCLSWV